MGCAPDCDIVTPPQCRKTLAHCDASGIFCLCRGMVLWGCPCLAAGAPFAGEGRSASVCLGN